MDKYELIFPRIKHYQLAKTKKGKFVIINLKEREKVKGTKEYSTRDEALSELQDLVRFEAAYNS